jgi:hypothetical protein
MRQFVIRSMATTGVIAGLLFTGAGVAAAQPEDNGSGDVYEGSIFNSTTFGEVGYGLIQADPSSYLYPR